MKKIPKSLHDIYPRKRTVCYRSVSSFKYPFTTLSNVMMLRLSPILGFCINRLQILRMYEMAYVAVRTIDDVADEGDSKEGESHLSQILDYLYTDRDPQVDDEILLQHIFDIAQTVGRDVEVLRQAFINIFECVYADAQRRTKALEGEHVIRSEKEIEDYVYQMELQGIFALIFEIFGEDKMRLDSFWSLVKAGRLHFYLIRDVVEDVAEGLINIPREYINDIQVMVKTAQDLENNKDISMSQRLRKIKKFSERTPGLNNWITHMIITGREELRLHNKQSQSGLRRSTKMLLWGSRRRTSIFFEKANNVLLTSKK